MLRAEGRRLKGEHDNLAVIIIDYLQLLSGSGRYSGRVEEISDISRALKTLAWGTGYADYRVLPVEP